MQIIICGAGQVGASIARYLAQEGNDVTVIDTEEEVVTQIGASMDVRAILGHAAYPDVLERAGARDANMLIAVTSSDEVNMIACQIGHSIFEVPTKIARVRNQSYLDPVYADFYSRQHMPIDVIISPEVEVAHAILRRLEVPGAFDMMILGGGLVRLVGVILGEECPVLNTPLRQLTTLFPDLAQSIKIMAIIRDNEAFIPRGDDQLHIGDQVYFIADAPHVARAMVSAGHEERQAARILILGGGNIGFFLAQELEKHYPDIVLRVVESDRKRAEHIAQQLMRATVIHGDALDPKIQEEAHVATTQTVVSVTHSDENNLLASLLAKISGAERTVALINNRSFYNLIGTLGIDTVVNPRASTISSILQHVRRGSIRAAYSLREGFAEVLEGEALETSQLTHKRIRDLDFPKGAIIGALIREGEVIIPHPETVIETGDRVIILAEIDEIKKVEKLFSVSLEYF